MSPVEVAQRLELLKARLNFPETHADHEKFTLRPDAFLAMLDLRNTIPDILLSLDAKLRSEDERVQQLRALTEEDVEAALGDSYAPEPKTPAELLEFFNRMLDRVAGADDA